MILHLSLYTLFPYTTLFRSNLAENLDMDLKEMKVALDGLTFVIHPDNDWATELTEKDIISIFHSKGGVTKWSDRKSTRLNSSHVSISYAVFCLKKKKTTILY